MSKLIVAAELSLDGKISNPKLWERAFNYHSEDVQHHLDELLFEPDYLIMGRLTYEAFTSHWPSQTGVIADKINGMPKYVASKSLKGNLDWNAKLLNGDLLDKVNTLKNDKVILQYGIGELTHFLIQNRLVDEIRLLIFPFTVDDEDKSLRFLGDISLALLSSKTFSSGAISVNYKVVY